MTAARTVEPPSAWMVEELAALVRLAHTAVRRVTTALVGERPVTDEQLSEAARIIGALRDRLEDDAEAVSQGPEGTRAGLPAVLLATHVGTELEGLTEAVLQLVELAGQRRSRNAFPMSVREPLREMAGITLSLIDAAAGALEHPGHAAHGRHTVAGDLELHQRLLYQRLLEGPEQVDAVDATDATLLSCRLLRVAHHADALIAPTALLTRSLGLH